MEFLFMYKIRRINNGVEIFTGSDYYNRVSLNKTTFEIIKAIKKYGPECAAKKISYLFGIDEKNAKKDIEIVLANLKTLKMNIDEIPTTVPKVLYAPRTIHFDINSRCNSKCIYCLASERMKNIEEMSTNQIINIIDQLPDLGTWILLISGGEPLLRKDLFEILDHIEKIHLLTQVFTNGTLITKEIAEKFSKFKYVFLQVSLDSHIPEHHDLNRGVKGFYEKTLRGIKYLLEYNVETEVCMVLTKNNYKDLEGTAEFLRNLGIKHIRIGPAHPYVGKGFENRSELELDKDQWKWIGQKILELNKKYNGSLVFAPTRHFIIYTIKPNLSTKIEKCGNGRSLLFIRPDGSVYPCIFLVYPDYIIGNATKEPLSKIWKNSNLLKKIRNLSVEDIKKCRTCDVKDICNAGCRANSYYHFKTAFEYDPLYCEFFGK